MEFDFPTTMKGRSANQTTKAETPPIHGRGEPLAPPTHSERIKGLWKTLDFRKRVLDGLHKALATVAHRDRMAATMERLQEDAAFRQRQSDAARAMWRDPVKRAQILQRRKETLAAHPEIAHERSKRGWRTRDSKSD
jgi:hypothetical protein